MSRGNLLSTEYWSKLNLRANEAVVSSTHTLSNFNLLSFFIFTKKLRGPERSPEGGPEWGPKRGSRRGVQVLSTPTKKGFWGKTTCHVIMNCVLSLNIQRWGYWCFGGGRRRNRIKTSHSWKMRKRKKIKWRSWCRWPFAQTIWVR